MLSTRRACKAVTSAGGSGDAPDESEYCAFGLEYCRKCHPKGGGLQYLRLDSGQAQTTKKADVLALLDRNGGFPLPSGEPNLMVSTRYSHVRSPPLAEAATPPEVVAQYSSYALARAHVAGPPPSLAITARGSGLGFACSDFEPLSKMALGEPGLRLDHINRPDRASGCCG